METDKQEMIRRCRTTDSVRTEIIRFYSQQTLQKFESFNETRSETINYAFSLFVLEFVLLADQNNC